ncbi:hypothetical protein [Terrarubrum flagellatum]|uniref:hypothetical protein n=1 Tax=Terrirubrum flagellatum TaxID=2895980 RepID=UPI003144D3FB
MANEIHVLFAGLLPSRTALRKGLRAAGFPFSFAESSGSLEEQSGYLPMKFRGQETGVEFDSTTDREQVVEIAGDSVAPSFDRITSFRWGGDETEMTVAFAMASALATLVKGVVFDEQSGELQSPDEAAAIARQSLATLTKAATAKHPGATKADLKRYLKPLLQRRDDLVLIDRMLIIRPVRHILRGVFFEPRGDRYAFQTRRYLQPLYKGGFDQGYWDDPKRNWRVYEPLFQPLFLDALGANIFDEVGRITSFELLAQVYEDAMDAIGLRAIALALAGRQGDGIALLEAGIESKRFNGYWIELMKKWKDWLNRDIKIICAELHEQEAAAVKALKIEQFWRPSPFPTELADANGSEQTDEPLFLTTNWPAPPANLIAEAPETPDEIHFGRRVTKRAERQIIEAPMSMERARQAHIDHDEYVRVERIDNERLIVIRHWSNGDLHRPEKPAYSGYTPKRNYLIWLFGSDDLVVRVDFSEDLHNREQLSLMSVDVYDTSAPLWSAHNDLKDGRVRIYDRRLRDDDFERRPMNNVDREICMFASPDFEGIDELISRFWRYLDHMGLLKNFPIGI